MRLQSVPPERLEAFIARRGRNYSPPTHLRRLTERLEAYRAGELRLVCSTPPRHGKTETLILWAVKCLLENPRLRIAYISYSAHIAESKSLRARRFFEEAGGRLDPTSNKVGEWYTAGGGGFFAAGVMGPMTGHGFDLIIVDDPVKNRQEAESPVFQQRNWEWFSDVAFTRLEPPVAGIVVNMARWHREDLAGRLLSQGGWEHINLPAIGEDGKALWPERYPLKRLEAIRAKVTTLTWDALYQGTPKPRGGAIYGEFSRDGQDGNVRPCPFDVSLPLVIGMDFNVDPMTFVVYQRHGQEWHVPEGGAIELPNSNTREAAKYLTHWANLKYGHLNWKREAVVICDPSGNARQHNIGTSDVSILEEAGFDVHFRRVKAESDKHNAFRAIIRAASGARRLFVDPSNARLIDRIENVRIGDEDDHLTDAAAYPPFFEGIGEEEAA